MAVPVSATLAINEALEERRRAGLPILPLGFGEAGLPVHPALLAVLSAEGHRNGYGPVAGLAELRSAAAGYWERRSLPTDPALILAGPGSKPLLYSLLQSIDGDVVLAAPSWVSYAAQVQLTGHRAIHVPTALGQGGLPQPDLLETTVVQARRLGRDVCAVVVTTPDNPTGTVASRDTMARLAQVARDLDLTIISDEIYRDLVHDANTVVHSAAEFAPERTVITTGLSKSLALGGWRLGLARFPDSPRGHALCAAVTGVASEIWSTPAAPIQQAAAYAYSEPAELTERIEQSRRLHGAVVRAVAAPLVAAGVAQPPPQAAFYLYPDFEPVGADLARRNVHTGVELAKHLLDSYGMGTVAAAEFEGGDKALRLRLATSQLYGQTDDQRLAALEAADPTALPWIRAQLDRLSEILADLLSGRAEPFVTNSATRDL